MTNKLKALAFLAIPLLATSANAATVVNGSFEDPGTFSGNFATYGAGNTSVTGWTIGGGGIDFINTYWTASDGSYSIDLNAGSAGTVSQSITGLVVGTLYNVLFDYAGNAARASVRTLSASVAGASNSYTFDTTGQTLTDMGWTEGSLSFTAGSTTELLTFASLTSGAYGPALDNVRVVEAAPIPVPAAGLLLLGGLLGTAAVGRRKSKRKA